MRVECEIEEDDIEDGEGRTVEGVRATCSQCQHQTESFGTGESSVKRCLALMREECEEGEENFYTAD